MTTFSTSLPKTMPAVICCGPRDYRLDEVAVPQIGAGEVLVRVKSVGICASDIKCYLGSTVFWGDGTNPGYVQPPVIPGHEFVGEVVALGEGAGEKYGLALGDMAISEQIVPCWNCRYCQRGQYWLCRQHDVYGFRQRTFGAMAEYMKFPADAINYKVPKTISPQEAVFIEPLACSIHAVERAEIQFGDVVVIAGAGPLGLGMIAAARMKSPALLIALDMSDARLEVAKKCGADLTFNPSRDDVIKEVLDLTEGYGCDVYIEATGHPEAVGQGLEMIRKRGTFVEFSIMKELSAVNWSIIGDGKELNIHGSSLSPGCYPIAIRMLEQKKLPMDAIVTHALPLSQVQQGLDLVASGQSSIKVTLMP